MATEDSKKSKEAQKQAEKSGKVDKSDLSEEELKEVSGGLYSSRGLTDTDPCISS